MSSQSNGNRSEGASAQGAFYPSESLMREPYRNAFLLLLFSCLKVHYPCPLTFSSCFPSCSVLLSLAAGTHTFLFPSPQASVSQGGRRRGRHSAMPYTACGPGPGVSSFCRLPLPQQLPLSHKMFYLCLAAPSLQTIPGRQQWDGRGGAPLERCLVPGLQAPVLGQFGDTCALRTGVLCSCTALVHQELHVAPRATRCVCGFFL